jgi:hypothetical protein
MEEGGGGREGKRRGKGGGREGDAGGGIPPLKEPEYYSWELQSFIDLQEDRRGIEERKTFSR